MGKRCFAKAPSGSYVHDSCHGRETRGQKERKETGCEVSGPAALRVGDHWQDDSEMRGDLRDAERPGQGTLSRMIANPSPGPPAESQTSHRIIDSWPGRVAAR